MPTQMIKHYPVPILQVHLPPSQPTLVPSRPEVLNQPRKTLIVLRPTHTDVTLAQLVTPN